MHISTFLINGFISFALIEEKRKRKEEKKGKRGKERKREEKRGKERKREEKRGKERKSGKPLKAL